MEVLQRTANRGSISTGYEIANSLKFEADNREYLRWNDISSYASSTRKKTFSFSAWVKLTEVGSQCIIWSTAANGYLTIQASGVIKWQQTYGGVQKTLNTNRVFRDTSAWYNIIIAVDSTQSTEANRSRLYVNGVEETSFSSATYPSQNAEAQNVYEQHHYVGEWGGGGSGWCGYIANPTFISDAQITPSDVGEFDEDSGIWIPKAYGGAISSPSYFLEFKDSSNLGNATSGLNVSTLNNITAADQATDTPTNNFATFNPLLPNSSEKEGATVFINPDAGADTNLSTIAVANGKWYAEFKASSNISGDNGMVGVAANSGDSIAGRFLGQDAWSVGLLTNGSYYINSSATSYLGTTFNQDIISVALDMDNKKVYFAKNGTWGNSGNPATGTNGIALPSAYEDYEWFIGTSLVLSTATYDGNYGGYTVISIASGNTDDNGYGTFEYAPPSGYYALCTKNLAEFG